MGRGSRQQPVRRVVTVKRPLRLPRPMNSSDLELFLGGLKRLRDLAMFLLMLDGGLRPGEVLSLHLEDIVAKRGEPVRDARAAAHRCRETVPW
jgi:integrase/recombinase XerD